MKLTPMRVFDYSVTKDWPIEKAAKQEEQIHNIIRFMEMRGKPLIIEYIDDNLNVVSTFKMEGNEKKFMEYETRMEKLLNGFKKEKE